ncbi:MAG: hypothetical protein AB2A00_03125 [Myxococcota bacterium]
MAHRIEVVVATRGCLASLAAECGAALVTLPQDFELLVVATEEAGAEALAFGSTFRALTRAWVPRLEAASRAGAVAYLETEYFAGLGKQAAAVWRGGTLVFGPVIDDETSGVRMPLHHKPINTALRMLGVTTRGEMDEFDSLQLGAARMNKEWAELAR